MDKLPIETLHNIFILLPLIQKLECMYVCRQWEHIIRTRSLLHTIYIKYNRNFNAFIDMIERQGTKAKQVEYLYLLNRGYDTGIAIDDFVYDNRKLLNLLPNLRQFHYKVFNTANCYKIKFWKRPFELLNHNPTSRVESIIETGACELTQQLMTSDLCAQLTKLELFSGQDLDIVAQLKNMPRLRQLKLINFKFNLNDFETLHVNIPSLEQISLVNINEIKGNVPSNILPATSVTYFSFSFISFVYKEQTSLLQYIHKKYTHLQHFHPNDEKSRIGAHFFGGLSDTIYSLTRIHMESIMPILKYTGYHLKSLSLRCDQIQSMDVFETLDNFTCQLEELSLCTDRMTTDILNALGESDQAKSIEKLTLTGMGPVPFDWLSKMVKLKTLEMEYLRGDAIETFPGVKRFEDIVISIDDILNRCKKDTFETLIMKHAIVKYKHDASQENNPYPFLKELELDFCSCEAIQFLELVSRTPNLSKLVLVEPTDFTGLKFPANHHFKHLEIKMELVTRAMLYTDNKSVLYLDHYNHPPEGYAMFGMDGVKGKVMDQISDYVHGLFRVGCSSVDNFIINGEHVYQF